MANQHKSRNGQKVNSLQEWLIGSTAPTIESELSWDSVSKRFRSFANSAVRLIPWLNYSNTWTGVQSQTIQAQSVGTIDLTQFQNVQYTLSTDGATLAITPPADGVNAVVDVIISGAAVTGYSFSGASFPNGFTHSPVISDGAVNSYVVRTIGTKTIIWFAGGIA